MRINDILLNTFLIQYSVEEEIDAFDSMQSITIMSVQNPQGAIRGTLTPIDNNPNRPGYTAWLDGEQVVKSVDTDARGCLILDYDCNVTRTNSVPGI